MKPTQKSQIYRSLACCAAVLLACASVTHAESPIVGDWVLTIEFGGAKLPASLTVNEAEDGSLSGVLTNQIAEMSIEVITFDGTEIGFDQEVDMAGTPMQFSFTGTVDGEAFTGLLKSDLGEMAVEGKRPSEGGGIVGTWNLTSDSQLGVLERVLTVNEDLSGTYATDDAEFAVTGLALDGDALTFDVTVDVQGQELPLAFEGKLDGDSISGDFLADGSSVAEVTGTRAGNDITALIGSWSLEADSPLGLLEHTLIVAEDGVKYDQDGEITELEGLTLVGKTVRFPINIQGYDVVFEGTLDGDDLTGDLLLDGEPVAPVVAKRGSSDTDSD